MKGFLHYKAANCVSERWDWIDSSLPFSIPLLQNWITRPREQKVFQLVGEKVEACSGSYLERKMSEQFQISIHGCEPQKNG